jgi:glutamine amidotransferase
MRRRFPISAGTRSSEPAPNADFYFVHSYAGAPEGDRATTEVLATTTHGAPFVSAMAREALLGVQFHPERSGSDGLRLLLNVVDLVASGSVRSAVAAPTSLLV